LSAFLNPRIASPSPLPIDGRFFGPKNKKRNYKNEKEMRGLEKTLKHFAILRSLLTKYLLQRNPRYFKSRLKDGMLYCFAVMNRTSVRMKRGRFMESLQQMILAITLPDYFAPNTNLRCRS